MVFNKLLSPRESVAPAHWKIIAVLAEINEVGKGADLNIGPKTPSDQADIPVAPPLSPIGPH